MKKSSKEYQPFETLLGLKSTDMGQVVVKF